MSLRSAVLPAFFAAITVACSPPPVSQPDASDGSVSDTGSSSADAMADVAAAMDAREDATASGDSGGVCSFNRDCPSDNRCECDESNGCRCVVGARGTRTFAQPCTSGNDCASALCVEGPSGFLCSDECMGAAQCSGLLPRCVSVPFVGMFCARNPPDAGASDAGAIEAGPSDASITTDAGTCSGPCATTSINAVFGAQMGPFDRAQHGISGADGIYVEAHFGGSPACPSMTSPTPDRTLVLANIRDTGDLRAQTYADGVRATLLDFRGTFTAAPLLRATDVRVVPRFVSRGVAVSYEFTATFMGGTISGSFFAPHCASLDG